MSKLKQQVILKRKIKKPGLVDLIFNDRNKNYGAFAIIKSSVRRIRISFMSATGIFLLLVLIIGGAIRIPWFSYSDETLVYNSVNVKYDPSLITVLSEPFKVTPKEDKKKIFTAPVILDEEKEVVQVEKSTKPEANPEPKKLNEELLRDSLKAIEAKADEKIPQPTKSKADSIVFVQQVPQFPGGDAALKFFITNNLKYPIDAINRKIQGTVVLNFIVEKDGNIRRIIITKAVDPVLDFEAVRIISSMPHWQAASMHGKPVAAMIVIPINFSLRP